MLILGVEDQAHSTLAHFGENLSEVLLMMFQATQELEPPANPLQFTLFPSLARLSLGFGARDRGMAQGLGVGGKGGRQRLRTRDLGLGPPETRRAVGAVHVDADAPEVVGRAVQPAQGVELFERFLVGDVA